jgi:hypothetical protein
MVMPVYAAGVALPSKQPNGPMLGEVSSLCFASRRLLRGSYWHTKRHHRRYPLSCIVEQLPLQTGLTLSTIRAPGPRGPKEAAEVLQPKCDRKYGWTQIPIPQAKHDERHDRPIEQ